MEVVYATMVQIAISLALFSVFFFRHGSNAKHSKSMFFCVLIFILSTPMIHKEMGGQIAGEIASYIASGALMVMISLTFRKRKAAQDNIMDRFRKAHLELDALRRTH